MMKKFTILFINSCLVLLIVCCVSVEDVRRSSDLIRTDNELARILEDVRPVDKLSSEVEVKLVVLADHAKSEAEDLKGSQTKISDAIAYYRIAATAYWASGKSEVVYDLFEVTDNGTKLCTDLKQNAPDRDCLFLQLVIPFAGLESLTKTTDIGTLLDSVNFLDNKETQHEIDTMGVIRRSLSQSKRLVQKILSVGEDNRLLSHPGMKDYYCTNAKEALEYFDFRASLFITKVSEFYDEFPNNTPPLNITVDEAIELQKLENDSLSFCRQ
jgi:hypothetical protein